MTTVLATGGAGYIGSHVVAALLAAGRRVVILDDFSNAARDVPERIAALGHGAPDVVEGDICDPARLEAVFGRFRIDAVIHMAGLKAVGESVAQPLRYMAVNVGGRGGAPRGDAAPRGAAAGLLVVGDGLRGAGAGSRSRRTRRSVRSTRTGGPSW